MWSSADAMPGGSPDHHPSGVITAVDDATARGQRCSPDRSGFEKRRRLGSRSLPPMKTMTCRQLGGPCDVEHHGKDHNEVIKAQDRHLKAQVAAGDETHREAHEAMRGRWKRPVSGLAWYRDVKREFATLPDDAS
jgi:predicted small metal-binding protein